MDEWTVTWTCGSTANLTEAQAERLETVLRREFGIDATRRRKLAQIETFRAAVRVPDEEVLVVQVREEQAE